jgi:hypothetical protein
MAFDSHRNVGVMVSRNGTTTETWEWDGAWHFRLGTGTPSGFGVLAYDSTRNVSVFVASNSGDQFKKTWEWNGNLWALRATAGPQGDSDGPIVFDRLEEESFSFAPSAAPALIDKRGNGTVGSGPSQAPPDHQGDRATQWCTTQ